MDAATSYVAPRTCAVVGEQERDRTEGKPTPLTQFADAAVYVLIAEPGAMHPGNSGASAMNA